MVRTSIARKIKFEHIPKTPVIGPDGKWTYMQIPDDARINATLDRLNNIDSKATSAEMMAQNAQDQVESKVSAEQAAEAARDALFEGTDKNGKKMIISNLKFFEGADGKWTMQFCAQRADNPTSGFCTFLGYATSDLSATVDDIDNRLNDVEIMLGL